MKIEMIRNMIYKLRLNHTMRLLFMPAYNLYKEIGIWLYQFTYSHRVIKSLRNRHEGQRCFIIGNGPSLTVDDLNLIKKEISFGCNRIYEIFDKTDWKPSYYLCIDSNVLSQYGEFIPSIKIPYKFIANYPIVKKGFNKRNNIYRLVMESSKVIKKNEFVQDHLNEDISRSVACTLTVSCTAIEMAIYMGFKEIYLLGIDNSFPVEINKMGEKSKDPSKKAHFYPEDEQSKRFDFSFVDGVTNGYLTCKKFAESKGVKIINCTRGGKLKVFKRAELEKILNTEKREIL